MVPNGKLGTSIQDLCPLFLPKVLKYEKYLLFYQKPSSFTTYSNVGTFLILSFSMSGTIEFIAEAH